MNEVKVVYEGQDITVYEQLPIDVNKVDYEMLLRVPGIGVKSACLLYTSMAEAVSNKAIPFSCRKLMRRSLQKAFFVLSTK